MNNTLIKKKKKQLLRIIFVQPYKHKYFPNKYYDKNRFD